MISKPTTAEETVSKTKEAVIVEAKKIEENCTLTAKGHFAAAHFWTKCHLWVGVFTAVLAGTAGTAALAGLDDPKHIFVGLVSIFVAILAGVSAFLNPNEKASNHLHAGNSYDSLLTRARLFWSIDCWGQDSDRTLTAKLKSLSDERDRLNATSLQVPRRAFRKAKKGIDEGEASYAVDQKQK